MKRRAIFLDRDGVINRMYVHPDFGTVDSPANLEQFEVFPGVPEAVANLNELGLLVIIVSNQPGVAKRKFSLEMLKAVEQKMIASIQAGGGSLDDIYYCLHHPEAVIDEYRRDCNCRKPKPGLLIEAARKWDIDLVHSYTVGDGITDIAAGHSVAATTIFVNSLKCYHCEALTQHARPNYVTKDLKETSLLIRHLEMGDKASTEPFVFKCTLG